MQYKTTKTHFEKFKKYGEHYRNIFGLKRWRIGYEHLIIDSGSYANTMFGDFVATIRLNVNWPDPVKDKELKATALHEICHVLVERLDNAARTRFSTAGEIREANEELVNTLEEVLKDKI